MTRRDNLAAGLGILLCVLLAMGACFRNSLWFLIAAAELFLGLVFACRKIAAKDSVSPTGPRSAPLALGTVLSLVLYAALFSVLLVTLRAALGWLDRPTPSFSQTSLPAYMQSSVLGFYDKSEVRLALSETLIFTVALALVFVQSAICFVLLRRRALTLHPAAAAFAVILYFSSVYFPPFKVDVNHWFPYIAAATGIRHGDWPYMSGFDSGYGLLAPAFLAMWLGWFGLSQLSLSATIMASSLTAGVASFVLIRRITGSRAVALFSSAYMLLYAANTLVVTSTFRAPLQIALGALLLYDSLCDTSRRWWVSLLFGVLTLWSPSFGAFAAAGFIFAHAYAFFHATGNKRAAHLQSMLLMLAGVAVPLAAVWTFSRSGLSNPFDLYHAFSAAGNLFLLGFANMAQYFDPLALPAFMLVLLYISVILHRLSRSKQLTRRSLFVGASLISAVPYVIYAIGRSDSTHQFAAYWSLIPSMSLLFYGFLRMLYIHGRPVVADRIWTHKPFGGSITIVCIVFLTLFPFDRLAQSVAKYTTGYERSREKWYSDCVAERGCDSDKKPSLKNYLKQANQPLSETNPLELAPALVLACRSNLAIVSYNDALIYAAADCYTPTGLSTVNLIVTQYDLDRYVALLAKQQHIIFDQSQNIYARWKGDLLGEIRSRLRQQGYVETPACGRFSILSKADPSRLLQQLCP